MQHLAKSYLKHFAANKNAIPCRTVAICNNTLITTPLAITNKHTICHLPQYSYQSADGPEADDRASTQTARQNKADQQIACDNCQKTIEENVQKLADKTELVMQLQIQIGNLEENAKEMRMEIGELQVHIKSVKEQRDKYLDRIDEMTAEAKKLSRENESKLAELKKAENVIQDLEQQVETEQLEERLLQAKLTALSMERDNHLQQLHRAVERAEIEEKELREKFNKDLDGLKKCNTEREHHMMEDCEWKLREIEKNYKSKLKCQQTLQEENTSKQIQELEWKLNSQQEHFNCVKQKMTKDMNEIETQLSSQTKVNETEVKQLKSYIQELQKGVRAAEMEMDEMKTTEKQMKQQLKSSKDQANDAKLLVSKFQNEICDIKERHEKLLLRLDLRTKREKDEIREQTSEIWKERLKQETSRLQSYLQDEYEEEKQFALELLQTKKNREINEMMDEFKDKEREYYSEMKRLQEKIKDYQLKCTELKDNFDKSKEENQKLRFEKRELEESVIHDSQNKVCQLPNVEQLQKQLQQLSLQQKEIDFNIKNDVSKVTHNDVQLKEEKVKILEKINGVLKCLLKTVCNQVELSLQSAEKKVQLYGCP
uniref:Uncharacterized protein n=1 Tax=Strigamia maritima TaxID=126957 RepID=T1JIB9_STRMM